MEFTVGMLAYSKAGRDKKKLFLILDIQDNYAYIADGDTRKAEKPKKKKLIHLQKINKVVENVTKDIENYEIRKIIAQYKPI